MGEYRTSAHAAFDIKYHIAWISKYRKRYWGQHLWARGYVCARVGAVDEDTIKHYIESQRWDEEDQGVNITAPTEP